jgi:hypothetical protein
VIPAETGPPPDGSGWVTQNSDHPARIVTPPKSSDTSKFTTIRRNRSLGKGLEVACIDANCLNCWCGRSMASMAEEANDDE